MTKLIDKIKPRNEANVKYKFPTGAVVKGQTGIEYFLSAYEAEEWELMCEDKSVSNEDFWKWWDGYREAHNIHPRASGWSAPKKDGLSSWWQYDLHRAFSSTPDSSVRLAIALGAVANTVRIIDDTDPPYVVQWATDDATSSTDLEDKIVQVNAKPIKVQDGSLSSADAIDVTTGFGLHEASHAKYTSGVADQIIYPERVEPWGAAMFLANVVEDVRIERLTSKEYPGFAPYFDKSSAYAWTEIEQDLAKRKADAKQAATWPECNLRDCLNAVVMWVKWPVQSATILSDPTYQAEKPWWDDWNSRYQSGTITLLEAVNEALDRLRSVNDEVEQEMEELTTRGTGTPDALLPTCTNDLKGGQLTTAESSKVNDLVREHLREWKPTEYPGVPRRKVFIRRPSNPRAMNPPKQRGVADRLKAALRFRPELPRYSERLLKNGTLDEDQLFRFSMQDDRMFERQVVEVYPNAQVTLLVDMSGSMQSGIPAGASSLVDSTSYYGHSRITLAQALARLFTGALSTMEGISPRVIGHTADNTMSNTCEIYELWDRGDQEGRLSLITEMGHANNLDGYAIDYCVQDLLARGGPSDKRLLIVLSDGQPSADGYGGSTALQHVRSVTDAAEKQGVFVLQIALADDLRPTEQAAMFRNWVGFTNYDELPRQLTRVLSAFLNR